MTTVVKPCGPEARGPQGVLLTAQLNKSDAERPSSRSSSAQLGPGFDWRGKRGGGGTEPEGRGRIQWNRTLPLA